MPWKECDTMSLREEFVSMAMSEGANLSFLCRRFGISRTTGSKWVHRYRAQGREGLRDSSRRPRHSPSRTEPWLEATGPASGLGWSEAAQAFAGPGDGPRPGREHDHGDSASSRPDRCVGFGEGQVVCAFRARVSQRFVANGFQRTLWSACGRALSSADGVGRSFAFFVGFACLRQ